MDSKEVIPSQTIPTRRLPMNISPINALERYFCLFYLSLNVFFIIDRQSTKAEASGVRFDSQPKKRRRCHLTKFPPFFGGAI